MNIESKRYKIQSTGYGFSVLDKQTKEHKHVSNDDSVPSSRQLAMMHENEFDATMRKLLNE